MTTTLSSKGQVVIPLAIRKKLGLRPGMEITCQLENGQIILEAKQSDAEATLVESDGYVALEAPADSPEMTPNLVKDILSEL